MPPGVPKRVGELRRSSPGNMVNTQQLKAFIKGRLGSERCAGLKRMVRKARPFCGIFVRLLFGRNLSMLARIWGTDKVGSHNYIVHYQKFFQPLRRKRLKILEIGIGGYDSPSEGGQSLRMWKCFFKNSRIYGLDIWDKNEMSENRITIIRGSQADAAFLTSLSQQHGPFDIIIDDGSHRNEHVIISFKALFPLLKTGGIYVVEDTQTAYWSEYGGGITPAAETSMTFFKKLVDGLNYEEYELESYTPSETDKSIVSIYFAHNLIFIGKGNNTEGSNMLGKRWS